MNAMEKAAVPEGIRRCASRGAKRARAGSSQQFYCSVGLRSRNICTWWVERDKA